MAENRASEVTKPKENEIRIRTFYCADPAPDLKLQQLYWQIGGDRVYAGQTNGRYQASTPDRNRTFSDCYEMNLLITSPDNTDRHREYTLFAINAKGTLQQKILVNIDGKEAERLTESETSKLAKTF